MPDGPDSTTYDAVYHSYEGETVIAYKSTPNGDICLETYIQPFGGKPGMSSYTVFTEEAFRAFAEKVMKL